MRKLHIVLLTLVSLSALHIQAQDYFVGSLATPGGATFNAGQDADGIITFPFGGGTRTVEVETNQTATVSSDADWCQVAMNGKTLTLNVAENTTTDVRTAIITVHSKDFHPLLLTLRQEGRLMFAVISDVHVGSGYGKGSLVKVPQALRSLTTRGKLDALFVVGDLTDGGKSDQYPKFVDIFGSEQNVLNPVGQLVFMMGNHDNYDGNGKSHYQQGLKAFNEGQAYPYHQYYLIKGYPFITISDFGTANNDLDNSSNGSKAYPQESVNALKQMLARAATEASDKPIFVFTHVGPTYGCYSSWADYENGDAWCMNVLNSVLNNYPQAVVFAGHSHYPLGDPRSIHQGINPRSSRQNYYTVINTASTNYSEIEKHVVDEGIHPYGYENVTEGMILVEKPNGDIEIRRYDTYHDVEINPENRWVLKAPFDGSMFQYADIRDNGDNPNGRPLRTGLPAPAFADHATLTLETRPYSVKVTYPQATDDDCVFRYRVRLMKGGAVLKSYFVFSRFYLYPDMPQELSSSFDGLSPETEYTAEVTAFDSYNNPSQPLSVTFMTPADDDPESVVPEAKGVWTFDDAADLMAGTGVATMKAATHSKSNVQTTDNPNTAGIKAVAGPSEDNGAVTVPVNSSLLMSANLGSGSLSTYTFMLDICLEQLDGYTALYQNDLSNNKDGSFFVKNGQVGLNACELGYNGTLTSRQWHRVLFVVKDSYATIYLDGKKVGQSTSASTEHWKMSNGALFFADNDGEEHDIQTAEIRFWNVALNDRQAAKLGSVVQKQQPVPTLPEAKGRWTFDNVNNLMTGTGGATLIATRHRSGSTQISGNPEDAGIKPVAGPSEENGAITIPVGSSLSMSSNLGECLTSYSLLLDIRIEQLGGYSALYQNDPNNSKDASFFVKNAQLGLSSSGLNYNGKLIAGQWYRVLFVVKDCYATIYVDGEKVGQSTSASTEHWKMNTSALLFADNDSEEHSVQTAEIRFWNTALTDEQVCLLGMVK